MIVRKLQSLKESVQKATARVGTAEGRPVPLFWSRQFSWAATDIGVEKFATMGNYAAGEVQIHALGAVVEFGSDLSALTGVAMRTESGYRMSMGTDASLDFEWNIQYNSSGMQYGVAGHTDQSPYLSSDVFRGESWGNRFEISPLRLGLNESIEIRVRPTIDYAYFFVLRFQAWGTRSYV